MLWVRVCVMKNTGLAALNWLLYNSGRLWGMGGLFNHPVASLSYKFANYRTVDDGLAQLYASKKD